MTGILIKRGNLDTEIDKHKGRQRKETQREDDHLQAKERDLEQVRPSWPSQGTNPANTLILDF